jgi:hypothetical protein
MKHLVVKHIGDNIFRNAWPVEATIHYDLAEGRIEAAQLCPPRTVAPGEVRRHQGAIEIPAIQVIKQQLKIVVLASGSVFHLPRAEPAQLQESLACRAGVGKTAVTLEQFGRRAPPVKPAQQDRRHSLDDSAWGACQGIRQPDVGGVVP